MGNAAALKARLLGLALLAAGWHSTIDLVRAAEPADTGKTAAGLVVDIELNTGRTLSQVQIIELKPGKLPRTFRAVSIYNPATQRRSTFGAAGVRQVAAGEHRLVYDGELGALAPADPKVREQLRRAAAKASPNPSSQPQDTLPEPERAEEPPADEETLRRQKEAQRLEFHRRTGVWLWPELSEQQQQEAVARQKSFLKTVAEAFPALPLRVYESEYFLFASDMPPMQVQIYTPYLDQMYKHLSNAFGIERGTNIWVGKAVVIVFSLRESYERFEQQFFNTPAGESAGRAHQKGDGTVIIVFPRGQDARTFAGVLVHETTHGFIHRYKSRVFVPTWLNEGMADWTAIAVVPNDPQARIKPEAGKQMMKQTRSLGGLFNAESLESWQYGAASGLVQFMLRAKPEAFRKLIDAIKLGKPWQEALQETYGVTPEELAFRYGLALGVPGLRP